MSDTLLPESWVKCELGDVVTYGASKQATPDEFKPDDWLLELEDIEKDTSKILQRITVSVRNPKSNKNRFLPGDVLYGKLRPYLNKVVIADQEGLCTTEIIPINPGLVEGRYLFYWLKSLEFTSYVNSVSHGLRMPRLGTKQAKAAPFVLPPAAEQTRIANKLDQLLAQVDTIKARVEAIPGILKRFRQSVLAAAVSGRLTEEWREQNETPSVVDHVDAMQAGKSGRLKVRQKKGWDDGLELFGLPSSWSWIANHKLSLDRSNAICAGPFGTIFKAKDFRDEGVPIIFLRHVKEEGFNQNKPKYMDTHVWEGFHQEYSIFGGELLVTKLGDPPGECCIYPEGLGTAMVTPDVLKMDVDNEVAEKEYLMHFFNSPICKGMVRDLAFGVTRLRIDIAMFKSFPIPTPPLEEQREIVKEVRTLFALADQIEERLLDTQSRVNSLTQSILAKAFRGELVPQNADDEPASVLLERIQGRRK